jgi:hypothetical protein
MQFPSAQPRLMHYKLNDLLSLTAHRVRNRQCKLVSPGWEAGSAHLYALLRHVSDPQQSLSNVNLERTVEDPK